MKYFKSVCLFVLVGLLLARWAFSNDLDLFGAAAVLCSIGALLASYGLGGQQVCGGGLDESDLVRLIPANPDVGMPISNMTGDLTTVRGGGNEFNAFNQ